MIALYSCDENQKIHVNPQAILTIKPAPAGAILEIASRIASAQPKVHRVRETPDDIRKLIASLPT